jgi:hypothetical protein
MAMDLDWKDLKINNAAVLEEFPEQQYEIANKFKQLTAFVQNPRHNFKTAQVMARTLNDPNNMTVWRQFAEETSACIMASLEEAMELPDSARLYPLNNLWGTSRDIADGLGNWPALKIAVQKEQNQTEALGAEKEQGQTRTPYLTSHKDEEQRQKVRLSKVEKIQRLANRPRPPRDPKQKEKELDGPELSL